MDYSTSGFAVFHYLSELLKFLSIESVMSIASMMLFVAPFSFCLQSFPASGSNELALCVRWPKYCNFSMVLPCIFRVDFLQDWLVWSPCSPRDSQKSSPAPEFEIINSLVLSLPYHPTVTSVHDYWKNHSFDYTNLFLQSDISAFLICCLLSSHPTIVHTPRNNGICTPMFTEALFIIAKTWKQPKCPPTDEMIKNLWYIYTHRNDSQPLKENERMQFAATWTDLWIII